MTTGEKKGGGGRQLQNKTQVMPTYFITQSRLRNELQDNNKANYCKRVKMKRGNKKALELAAKEWTQPRVKIRKYPQSCFSLLSFVRESRSLSSHMCVCVCVCVNCSGWGGGGQMEHWHVHSIASVDVVIINRWRCSDNNSGSHNKAATKAKQQVSRLSIPSIRQPNVNVNS